jgi:hypothetical protein
MQEQFYVRFVFYLLFSLFFFSLILIFISLSTEGMRVQVDQGGSSPAYRCDQPNAAAIYACQVVDHEARATTSRGPPPAPPSDSGGLRREHGPGGLTRSGTCQCQRFETQTTVSSLYSILSTHIY